MYRSSSWTRVTDDYYSSPKAAGTTGVLRMSSSMEDTNELPIYDPVTDVAKKDKPPAKFAENAIHFIPVVLLICFFVLWLFSNPDVEVGTKVEKAVAAAKVEGLTIEGDIDHDSDGTQTGFLPMADNVAGDNTDTSKQGKARAQKASRKLQNYNDLNSQTLDSLLV